jgi:signal transduction histidine kinase
VSIGLPVYNGARFLEEAVDALLAQTYADFELIICDNGSSDGTPAICRAYAKRDERVSFHPSDRNRGAAWNYNRALALASGRYFKWATHDDVCGPTMLERCVEVLDRAPASVVLTYPRTTLIDVQGNPIGPYPDGLDLRQRRPHRRVRQLIRRVVKSNAVFGLVRTEALRRTRGHGSYISADYVLLVELALQGQFWEIPEPLFFRREHRSMSRRANTTKADLAEWFLPGSGTSRTTEHLRLFHEYLEAVERAELGRADRLLVYAFTLPPWLRRFRRGMAEELLGHTRSLLVARERPASAAREPEKERFRVHDAIREAMLRVAPDFAPAIRIDVDPELGVVTDRAAFDRVVSNLISNAVRYGDAPIVVRARADGDFVLSVEDAGRGLSAAFLPLLFRPFSRSEESSRSSGGLGLGLAVSQLAAQSAGGTLVYEPREVGACFRLVLPPSAVAEPGPRTRPFAARATHAHGTSTRPSTSRPGARPRGRDARAAGALAGRRPGGVRSRS